MASWNRLLWWQELPSYGWRRCLCVELYTACNFVFTQHGGSVKTLWCSGLNSWAQLLLLMNHQTENMWQLLFKPKYLIPPKIDSGWSTSLIEAGMHESRTWYVESVPCPGPVGVQPCCYRNPPPKHRKSLVAVFSSSLTSPALLSGSEHEHIRRSNAKRTPRIDISQYDYSQM